MEPTTNANDEPEPNGKCLSWCNVNKKAWKGKCKLDNCNGCDECAGKFVYAAVRVSYILHWTSIKSLLRASNTYLGGLCIYEKYPNHQTFIWMLTAFPTFAFLFTDLSESAKTTESASDSSGKCLARCGTNKKAWDVKCTWENICDACSDCDGKCFCLYPVVYKLSPPDDCWVLTSYVNAQLT